MEDNEKNAYALIAAKCEAVADTRRSFRNSRIYETANAHEFTLITLFLFVLIRVYSRLNSPFVSGNAKHERRATYAYFDVHPEELPKVPWYERLFALFKEWIRKLTSGRRAMFSDADFRKLFRDMLKAVKEDRPYRQNAAGAGRALARKDANGNYVQEFGQRNTIVPDDTTLKIVPVSTMQYVSTVGNADEIAAHHLRTDDADNIIKRKINEARKAGEEYIVRNDETGMNARIGTNQRNEIRHNFKLSSVPGYVYAAAMANIESLFKDATLCLSHDDKYSVNPDGSLKPTDLQQMHRFFVVMEYENNSYAVKLSAKEYKSGVNVFYTLETHGVDISRIKKAPNGSLRTGGRNSPPKRLFRNSISVK